jgi:hypothetical protein
MVAVTQARFMLKWIAKLAISLALLCLCLVSAFRMDWDGVGNDRV